MVHGVQHHNKAGFVMIGLVSDNWFPESPPTPHPSNSHLVCCCENLWQLQLFTEM